MELHGRERERAAIEALLARAGDGRGGGMVLHGEPGIGKTALLGHAAGRAAAAGLLVLRTAGAEPESALPYATLHRLLQPVLDRVAALPPPQERSLRAVFGQVDGPPADPYLVALATLSLLSDLGGVVCLADDAHWADRPSLDVLAFVARRVAAEPVALLLAARADEGAAVGGDGLAGLPLSGVGKEAARALLGDGFPEGRLDESLRATAGNPLALQALARGDRLDPRAPVTLADGLRSAFLRRVERRGEEARRLLLLIAADGTGRVDVLRRAAGRWDPDELADLVRVDGATVAFDHPLMRAAVYHGAGPAGRRAAHLALAAALDGDPAEAERRAWHLGQAAEGPDEEVAAELERSARRTARQLGPAAAAAALSRAAELSPPGPARARRLAAAASSSWHGGDAPRARTLLDRAEDEASYLTTPDTRERAPSGVADGPERGGAADAVERDPGGSVGDVERVRVDVAVLRALIEARAGTPAYALTLLRPLIAGAAADEVGRALELLVLYGEATYRTGTAGTWEEIGAAAERLPLTGSGADEALGRLVRGVMRVRSGGAPGLHPEDLDIVQRIDDPERLSWAGGMVWSIGERERGGWMRREAVRLARAVGAAGTLARVLEFVVADEMGAGRFAAAEAYAEEGLRFAAETGQPNLACGHRAWLAMVAALRGREDEARRLAADVLTDAVPHRLDAAAAMAHRTLGVLDLAAGRWGDALRHLRTLARTAHPGFALQAVPDHVEAAVRGDRPEEAAERFAAFDRWARAANAPEPLALAARCRALLGSAEERYREALDLHARAGSPMELARTELLLGEHLRRDRRPADARAHLRAAMETFTRIGAAAWADRAREELRASGGSTGGAAPDALAALTPQELRIALAVSEGVTNREVAAQLFLSPRTVEYHLRKIFQKTGTGSRAELILLVTRSDIKAT
ncbi:AAA family ATPase [Nonomuraea sp. NPDC048826]|uniref:helix-turn-helix transcriptional regulator n=1 Tax=Nonomuraea sp. NPDC048826 TaxID=3364347 RepID=UPI0037242977